MKSGQVIQETYKVTSRFGGTIPHHDYLKQTFQVQESCLHDTIPTENG